MTTEEELEERLSEVEEPLIGDDIVSLGLVNRVKIEGDTAHVSLAFNSPFAPTEMDLGQEIRAVIEDEGLNPE
ncbi:MAG: iron-sulfur cluster assembly protein, partial [Halohasta sp.]